MPVCAERPAGHYWVKIADARRPWHIAYWTGEHFEMFRHPTRFSPTDFDEIGPRVEDQLLSAVEAYEDPHYGFPQYEYNRHLDDALQPISNFVKEANLK